MTDMSHCGISASYGDGFESDAVVVELGRSGRCWVQSADILVSDHPSLRAARQWLKSAFHSYPGCTVAVTRHTNRQWFIMAVRRHPPLLVVAGKGGAVPDRLVESAARALYAWMLQTGHLTSGYQCRIGLGMPGPR